MNCFKADDASLAPIKNCQVILAKADRDRFLISFYKDGRLIRERVWKSRNTLLDELKKSGALQNQLKWPKQFGDKIIFEVENPTHWYWNEA